MVDATVQSRGPGIAPAIEVALVLAGADGTGRGLWLPLETRRLAAGLAPGATTRVPFDVEPLPAELPAGRLPAGALVDPAGEVDPVLRRDNRVDRAVHWAGTAVAIPRPGTTPPPPRPPPSGPGPVPPPRPEAGASTLDLAITELRPIHVDREVAAGVAWKVLLRAGELLRQPIDAQFRVVVSVRDEKGAWREVATSAALGFDDGAREVTRTLGVPLPDRSRRSAGTFGRRCGRCARRRRPPRTT